MTILLIEDDPAIARGLQVNLESEGYRVLWANSLKSAFEINHKEKLSLAILDLGLIDGSGFDFLRTVREQGSRLPIIILTAKTDEDSVVEGLQRGANDYMKKPFGNKELLARIKATLREPHLRENQIRWGDLLILVDQRVVRFKDTTVDIQRREFDILLALVEKPDVIINREYLIQQIGKDGEIFDRTIDSHISHLRSRLKKSGVNGIKISSVYGLGYRLEKV
ncbi:MAG: response regulator transcription factor [Bdellovibrionales bacterium]|nr:response regulator transcription factor [Bdellovibrionales bacterium]